MTQNDSALHGGFLGKAARIVNARQANTLLFAGNVDDLFRRSPKDAYQPLPSMLAEAWSVGGRMVVVYELNGPIRFRTQDDRERLKQAWLNWRTGISSHPDLVKLTGDKSTIANVTETEAAFERDLERAIGRPTLALELLRQLCCCSREALDDDLIIIVEAADLMLPEAPITQLNDSDRHRLGVCIDWFSDPGFSAANDVVLFIAQAAGAVHQRVRSHATLIDIPHPALNDRQAFIEHELEHRPDHAQLPEAATEKFFELKDIERCAAATAGLSLLSLRQLLRGALYRGELPAAADITTAVQQEIRQRLGDDVVDFARPGHRLEDVIGFSAIKTFLAHEVVPRFRIGGEVALTGAAVGGPIGAGKTFLFEAFAAELELPVLVLKNIRSKWYGGTDILIEQLRAILAALERAVLLIDEADTMFAALDGSGHETEKRLTGKIQGMMSDPKLKGKIFWLLMTARVHRLSPDIRRPGRVGDLIIPILDPVGPDRAAFVDWLLEPLATTALTTDEQQEIRNQVVDATFPTSAADFAALRSELKATLVLATEDQHVPVLQRVQATLTGRIAADIGPVRRYQSLQAMLNCTRRELLPDPEISPADRSAWRDEIAQLEAQGVG
jgi:hypothetical protein